MKSIYTGAVLLAALGLASAAHAQAQQRSSVVPGELRASGGRRTLDAIRFLLMRNSARVHLCYDTALRTNPNLAGTLIVRFAIEQDGVVSSATQGERTLPDRAMVDCVTRSIMALRYPPSTGGSATVSYTLRFVPGLTRHRPERRLIAA